MEIAQLILKYAVVLLMADACKFYCSIKNIKRKIVIRCRKISNRAHLMVYIASQRQKINKLNKEKEISKNIEKEHEWWSHKMTDHNDWDFKLRCGCLMFQQNSRTNKKKKEIKHSSRVSNDELRVDERLYYKMVLYIYVLYLRVLFWHAKTTYQLNIVAVV